MRLPLAAAVLAFLPHSLLAETAWGFGEDDTAGLRAMLDLLPAAMVQTTDNRAEIGFGDLAAARGLVGPGSSPRMTAGLRAAARAMPPGPVAQQVGYGPEAWREAVGFAIDDVERVILFDMPPLAAGVWDLRPGVAAGVPAVLRARGYDAVERDGGPVLAFGEDMRIDIATRQPGDPFRGELGRSARVTQEGAILRHASAWPVLAALQGASRAPAGQEPVLSAMLDRLEGLDRGVLVRAELVPDASGIALGDPLAAVTGGAPGGSAVAWESLLLADFTTGPESTAVLVLSVPWPEEVSPDSLAQAVSVAWQARPSATRQTFAERLGVLAEVEARRGPAGRALLRLMVTVPTTESPSGAPVNRGWEILLGAYATRDMAFLP